MGVFSLKFRDTRPILEVALKNPDKTPHDLDGSTSWKLHIRLSGGGVLTRTMVKQGADTDGLLRYSWIATDWDAVSAGGTVGGLVVGPTIPLAPGQVEHRMEYEVISGTSRLTFPNGGKNISEAYDTLRIFDDIGNG